MKLNFSLTIDHTKLVISALAALPFSQVAELINDITNQANEQIARSQGGEVNHTEEADQN